MTLELQISSLSGPLCSLSAQADWHGRDLKEAIFQKVQIPCSKQKLLYGTTLIRNADLLSTVLVDQTEYELLLVRQAVDFDYWLDEISKDYRRLRKAPEELRADPDVIMEAMNQDAQAFKFAADSVKANRDCALKALQANWSLYEFIGLDLWDDREICKLFVPSRPLLFRRLSQQLKADKELAATVLANNNGWHLMNMVDAIRADRDLVLLSARNPGETPAYLNHRTFLSFVDPRLRSDKEVVLECAKFGCKMEELPKELLEDQDVLHAVLAGNPKEVVHVPSPSDLPHELLLIMLKKDGMVLELLPHLADDRECVKAAVTQCCFALQFASVTLRGDREMAQLAIERFQGSLPHEYCVPRAPSPHLHVQRDVVALPFLASLSKELRADKELMLEVLRKDGRQLCVVEPNLLADREVVYTAVSTQRCGTALEFVVQHCESEAEGYPKSKSSKGQRIDAKATKSTGLLEDVELLVKAVSTSREAIKFCPKHLRKEVQDILDARIVKTATGGKAKKK